MATMTISKPEPAVSDTAPHHLRDVFDALPPLPGVRAEVIEGKVILSPLGTPEHHRMAMELAYELLPLSRERGWWQSAGGVSLCIEGPRDSYQPDYLLAPADCPRWGHLELLSSGIFVAAEVVSPSSAHDDRQEKPKGYAVGKVPIYLLIDPIGDEPGVTVYSKPVDGAYTSMTKVTVGSPITLPEPVGFELDTSIFKG
ncbi:MULTISPECIES: Uma2 family endonuclease [Nonomuraea]|uniref:Uma2 family endonuclease n=1 Tax=Nonomuraea TaxID=83681 RepID=UPI001C5DEE44|nr:Uma2 family endonuclease [Nonomuraea ceibae]